MFSPHSVIGPYAGFHTQSCTVAGMYGIPLRHWRPPRQLPGRSNSHRQVPSLALIPDWAIQWGSGVLHWITRIHEVNNDLHGLNNIAMCSSSFFYLTCTWVLPIARPLRRSGMVNFSMTMEQHFFKIGHPFAAAFFKAFNRRNGVCKMSSSGIGSCKEIDDN